jgi:hypothetical protein
MQGDDNIAVFSNVTFQDNGFDITDNADKVSFIAELS